MSNPLFKKLGQTMRVKGENFLQVEASLSGKFLGNNPRLTPWRFNPNPKYLTVSLKLTLQLSSLLVLIFMSHTRPSPLNKELNRILKRGRHRPICATREQHDTTPGYHKHQHHPSPSNIFRVTGNHRTTIIGATMRATHNPLQYLTKIRISRNRITSRSCRSSRRPRVP